MAIAQKWLANRYNKPGFEIFDYNIYAVCGDGCMMEGVASEAASLAGHLGLDNLCWVWDNNHISIEGNTNITFTEDVAARFLAYGWNVLRVGDANDIDRIEQALTIFQQTKGRPTFIVLDSHIGYGSPHKQDTAEAHGEPLGDEEIRLAKSFTAGPKTRSSSCLTASMAISKTALANAARTPEQSGCSCSRLTANNFPISRRD
jgi:transketolase